MNRLKQRREELGLSQEELAKALQLEGLDISRAAISAWESERNRSPLDNIEEFMVLAKVLKIDVSELQKGEQSEQARRAASIIEHMSPQGRQLALEQLRALAKYFPLQ
jgi:transcriptional regulator with XRE-family HTH domain